MVVSLQPPIISAANQGEIADARLVASRSSAERIARRRFARREAASAIPYLTGSVEGRQFLASGFPRAIARGEPAALCPAVAVAAPAGARPEDAAAEALGACIAQLAARSPEAECTCRVLALDNVLTVTREETAYATGISARLASPALDLDLLLVAEETLTGTILLRDLRGEVGRITQSPDDTAALTLSDGAQFEGRRVPVGWRRGRLAARYYLADEAGRRISVLVGFDPDELAAVAGGWLAWGG